MQGMSIKYLGPVGGGQKDPYMSIKYLGPVGGARRIQTCQSGNWDPWAEPQGSRHVNQVTGTCGQGQEDPDMSEALYFPAGVSGEIPNHLVIIHNSISQPTSFVTLIVQ